MASFPEVVYYSSRMRLSVSFPFFVFSIVFIKVINISRKKFFYLLPSNVYGNLFTEYMFIGYLLCAKHSGKEWEFGEEYVKSMSS